MSFYPPPKKPVVPVCPKCKGKGHIITDILTGLTAKCPDCKPPAEEGQGTAMVADPSLLAGYTDLIDVQIGSEIVVRGDSCPAQLRYAGIWKIVARGGSVNTWRRVGCYQVVVQSMNCRL